MQLRLRGDERVAVGQALRGQRRLDLLLPDDFVPGVALGDAVAVVFGYEDVVVRQQLGVERKAELADLQTRMIGAVQLQDAALVEQDDRV